MDEQGIASPVGVHRVDVGCDRSAPVSCWVSRSMTRNGSKGMTTRDHQPIGRIPIIGRSSDSCHRRGRKKRVHKLSVEGSLTAARSTTNHFQGPGIEFETLTGRPSPRSRRQRPSGSTGTGRVDAPASQTSSGDRLAVVSGDRSLDMHLGRGGHGRQAHAPREGERDPRGLSRHRARMLRRCRRCWACRHWWTRP